MIDTSAANSRQEKVKIITDKLEQGIKDLMNSDNYKEWLSKMSALHRYSFGNQVLIFLQKPDASMVAGMTTWNKDFKRSINKGEKGLVILAPCPFKKTIDKPVFDENGNPVLGKDGEQETEKKVIEMQSFRPVYVYDVSQTSGEPVPTLGPDELNGTVENYDKIFEALKEVSPVPITFEAITDGSKGYYSHTEKRIAIKEGLSPAMALSVLAHEISHSLAHSQETLKATGEIKDRRTKEVEAESISFAVSSYLGLDTSEISFPYIAGWAGERKLDAVKESMETIRKYTSDIICAVERHLHPELSLAESQTQTKSKARARSA